MRYYYNRKATTEESHDISVRTLKKRKLLSGKHSITMTWTSNRSDKTATIGIDIDVTEDPHVRLYYTKAERDGTQTDYDYEISLVTTDCYFGGVRYWFACPMCWQRVGVIYLAPNDAYFRCRHCNDLTYLSRNVCNTSKFGIACRKADRLRAELKRWTYRGRPTRKVRQLRRVEQRANRYGGLTQIHIDKMRARLERHM